MCSMEHVPCGNFNIHIRGDATLTMGPYGSTGTFIINYAPPENNVVVNGTIHLKALFDCSSQYQPYGTISAASQCQPYGTISAASQSIA